MIKLVSFSVLSGSLNTNNAIRNWMVGLMYIRNPTVDKRNLRAAPAKASRGIAVAAPLESSKSMVAVSSEKCDAPA